MPHDYRIIDAFCAEPFGGNPAAVVLDAEDLDDATMQRIATEFNLSETTFVLPAADPAAGVQFRWFTPAVEVDLCGHATVAGVHALHEAGQLADRLRPDGILRIETRSGILEAQLEIIGNDPRTRQVWLELPRPTLRAFVLKPSILREGLRIEEDAVVSRIPVMMTGDRDVILFVRGVGVLRAIRPNFSVLGEQCAHAGVRGMLVATTGSLPPHVQVETRFFAPAAGIHEDPVTGSATGSLLAYMVLHGLIAVKDGLAGLTCLQGLPGIRSGLVRALGRVDGTTLTDVQIGGRATTVMAGTLVV
ncbi:MAG: PhzF family phenazine biosynthesis protein [Phycisphaerales bacterium]|nr:MAG: PhzF family phenazine biosynthesis protein [Phycisphaerales bacterium]